MNEVITIQQAVLAIATGKAIQYRIKGAKTWHDLPGNGHQLSNHRNFDFRVKPKDELKVWEEALIMQRKNEEEEEFHDRMWHERLKEFGQ